jgi:hypothetical protein
MALISTFYGLSDVHRTSLKILTRQMPEQNMTLP